MNTIMNMALDHGVRFRVMLLGRNGSGEAVNLSLVVVAKPRAGGTNSVTQMGDFLTTSSHNNSSGKAALKT